MAHLRICRALLRIYKALLRIHLIPSIGQSWSDSVCGGCGKGGGKNVGLFCGYVGLFCGYVGLFGGYVGLFGGYILSFLI